MRVRRTLTFPGMVSHPSTLARQHLEKVAIASTTIAPARVILERSLGVKPGTQLAIVFDRGHDTLARAFDLASRALGLEVVAAMLDPAQDARAQVAMGIDALASSEVSVILLDEAPRPESPHFQLVGYAPTRKRLLVFGAREACFGSLLPDDHEASTHACHALVDRLRRAEALRIVSGGTLALEVALSASLRTAIEDGIARPEHPAALLPAGIVEAHGVSPSGRCLATQGVILGGKQRVGVLGPLCFTLERGRVVDVTGRESARVLAYLEAHADARHLSHIGFGMNTSLRVAVHTMQDLRLPGTYLVLGAHPARPTWHSPDAVHVLLRDASAFVDERALFARRRTGTWIPR